jgi:hypothetical protein
MRAEGELTLKPARDSGRPCGCDPAADHPCAGHAGHRDDTETEIAQGYQLDAEDTSVKLPIPIIVGGPDADGEIMVLTTACLYLSRFEAEDLALEILRRLRPVKREAE